MSDQISKAREELAHWMGSKPDLPLHVMGALLVLSDAARKVVNLKDLLVRADSALSLIVYRHRLDPPWPDRDEPLEKLIADLRQAALGIDSEDTDLTERE